MGASGWDEISGMKKKNVDKLKYQTNKDPHWDSASWVFAQDAVNWGVWAT